MQILVENENVINKVDLQSFVDVVPASWLEDIEKLTVFEAVGSNLITSFHSTEKAFGIHVSDSFSGSKEEIFREVAVTLQAIADFGFIPEKVPSSRIKEYLSRWNERQN